MSWRSDRTEKYNRSEETEYWIKLVTEEIYWDCPWMHDWDEDDYYGMWSYYHGMPGEVTSMDEYHTMKVLTLLRKLNLRAARDATKDRGW